MPYAYLLFGRTSLDMVQIDYGGQRVVVPAAKLDETMAQLAQQIDTDHRESLAEAARMRADLVEQSRLREMVAEERRVSSAWTESWDSAYRTETSYHDEAVIDGTLQRFPAGEGKKKVAEAALERFPDPVKPSPDTKRVEAIRSWRGTFVDGDTTVELTPPQGMSWEYGFPATWVTSELARYEREGWSIVQATEDHGLYRGEDAADEAYVTRIRYLLRKSR